MNRVVTWLNDLATLTAGTTPLADSKAKVAALASMLASEYPPEAFSRRSLEHIARQCTFFPSYGELARALSAWWQDNRPPQQAVEYDRFAVSDEETAARRASWVTISPEQVRAKVRALDGHPMREALGKALATALFHNAPKHLGYLPPELLKHLPAAEVVPLRPAS